MCIGRIKCHLAIALVVLSASCSSKRAGLDELQRLCSIDAGFTIYKTVEAQGYYDDEKKSGALRSLLSSGFRFIEFCDFNPNTLSILVEPGCARYVKVDRKPGQCNPAVDKILYSAAVEPYVSFREKYCIGLQALPEPRARYGFYSRLSQWTSEDGESDYIRSESMLKEVSTQEVLGRYVSYSHKARKVLSWITSCDGLDESYPSYEDTNFFDSILSQKDG